MMVVIAMKQDFSKLLRQPAERAGAVADEGDADVHAFEEGLPEVGDGSFLRHAHVASGLDGAAVAEGEVVLHGEGR